MTYITEELFNLIESEENTWNPIDYALTDYTGYDSIEIALLMKSENEYNPCGIAELLKRNGDNYSSYEDIRDAYQAAMDETLHEVLSGIDDSQFIDMYMDWIREYDQEDLYPVYYSMDEFNEILQGYEPHEIVSKCFYGDFRPRDDYFYFDGYANIRSLNEWEVVKEIHEYLASDDLWDVIEIAGRSHDVKKGWF